MSFLSPMITGFSEMFNVLISPMITGFSEIFDVLISPMITGFSEMFDFLISRNSMLLTAHTVNEKTYAKEQTVVTL